jgi:adenosylcobinamide-GDP ribazoletransferase
MGTVSGFRQAVALLTRIPVSAGPSDLSSSVAWFPVVGAGVGSVVGGVYVGLSAIVPGLAAAGVALAVGLLLTGGFHEDGLADSADALGTSSPQHALEIMRDPRHGTFGVAAVSLSLLVRAGAIAALGGWAALASLVAAHALSRGAAVGLLANLRPAESGMGSAYANGLRRGTVATGYVTAAILGAAGLGLWAVPAAVITALAAVVTGAVAGARFGGMTGDVLGAAQQLAETGVLLLAAGVATAGLPIPAW